MATLDQLSSLTPTIDSTQELLHQSVERIKIFTPLVARDIKELFLKAVEAEDQYSLQIDNDSSAQMIARLEMIACRNRLATYIAKKAISINYLPMQGSFRVLFLSVLKEFDISLAKYIYGILQERLENTKIVLKQRYILSLSQEILGKFPGILFDSSAEVTPSDPVADQYNMAQKAMTSLGFN